MFADPILYNGLFTSAYGSVNWPTTTLESGLPRWTARES